VYGIEPMTDQVRQTAQSDPRLFGSSGIRGVVGEDFSEGLCLDVARAIGSTLPPNSKVCIATDTRVSREVISHAVTTGLRTTGIDVTHLGILPTPVLAFLTGKMGFDTGVMVTASHNPSQFNGIKLFNADCIGYSRAQEIEIERIYGKREFRNSSRGSLETNLYAREYYLRFVANMFPSGSFSQGFSIVVDAANGAAAGFASDLFSRVGLKVIPLNNEADGLFPGRNPEPREDTLEGTFEFMRRHHASLAVCFDGDADRVVFLDETGFLGFNEVIAFAARLAVVRSGKKKVAATVETGNMVDLVLNDLGAEVVRGKVGDVYVAHLVRELDAAIGVEPAGVYIMPEIGLYPDSMFAALTLLSRIDNAGEIRSYLQNIPRLYSLQDKVSCPNIAKTAVMNEIEGSTAGLGPHRINALDGLRLEFDDSWMLIRASGTEPLIRVNAESSSETKAKALLSSGVEIVRSTISRLAR
jgi:phosphoglucosamine mutase